MNQTLDDVKKTGRSSRYYCPYRKGYKINHPEMQKILLLLCLLTTTPLTAQQIEYGFVSPNMQINPLVND